MVYIGEGEDIAVQGKTFRQPGKICLDWRQRRGFIAEKRRSRFDAAKQNMPDVADRGECGMDGGGKDNEVGAQGDEAFQLPETRFRNGAHHHQEKERGQRYDSRDEPVAPASRGGGPVPLC